MHVHLGPLLFFWPRRQVDAFYRAALDTPCRRIYLGETVCPKRRELKTVDWLEWARELTAAGKEAVLSTLALIQTPAELRVIQQLCEQGGLQIEANDPGTVQLAHEHGLPFVAGPALNVYNLDTLRILLDKGMTTWVPPVELSRDWLLRIHRAAEDAGVRDRFRLEVFGYGHLPLAWSARCFTARAENRPKDECGLMCIDYPAGRPVSTQEGQPVFNLNGIQTQSGYCYNLINDRDGMAGWVDAVRISAHSPACLEWIARFNAPNGKPWPLASRYCNGYWNQLPGMEWLPAPAGMEI
ncbi:U32 family peptidase [Oceanimonas pelagia]|uniref:Ubiquinone biosynthesis protein UbiV n=1 Tax=Oceanimonas pelagia TaxID=3028314 RepID=A0AA50KLH6_9GAMM|nr:U32 family peptidase [Oceanimonas pelagia]WMC09649.1 U32 family peptidase [Oceanimonas pelagia]